MFTYFFTYTNIMFLTYIIHIFTYVLSYFTYLSYKKTLVFSYKLTYTKKIQNSGGNKNEKNFCIYSEGWSG